MTPPKHYFGNCTAVAQQYLALVAKEVKQKMPEIINEAVSRCFAISKRKSL